MSALRCVDRAPDAGRLRSEFEHQLYALAQMARLHEHHVDQLMRQRRQDERGFWKVEITPEERDMLDFATANLVERARALDDAWQVLERTT